MLNFSQEQIDEFQKWKKEYHDEITRHKKDQEQKGYSNQCSNFYKWLCKIEKAIDEVEITIPSEATNSLRLSNYSSTVSTELKFGGLMERYSEQMTTILYIGSHKVENYYESNVDEVQLFAAGKENELKKIFDLFD